MEAKRSGVADYPPSQRYHRQQRDLLWETWCCARHHTLSPWRGTSVVEAPGTGAGDGTGDLGTWRRQPWRRPSPPPLHAAGGAVKGMRLEHPQHLEKNKHIKIIRMKINTISFVNYDYKLIALSIGFSYLKWSE